MIKREQIDNLLTPLRKHELVIAALYDRFGDLSPESKETWKSFADEERLHARWIDVLHAHLNDETISFEQTRMTTQSTTIAIEYIERQITPLEKGPIDLGKDMAMAVDIEKSLLESAFFKVFKLSGPKAETIRSRLMAATEAHIKRLTDWQIEIKIASKV